MRELIRQFLSAHPGEDEAKIVVDMLGVSRIGPVAYFGLMRMYFGHPRCHVFSSPYHAPHHNMADFEACEQCQVAMLKYEVLHEKTH